MNRRLFLKLQATGILSLFSYPVIRCVSADTHLLVTSFKADATPPLGTPWYPSYKPLDTIEHPLLAKGIILESSEKRFVLCVLDWCEIANSSYYRLRELIAKVVETDPDAVFVHTVHQHTAPMCDADAFDILSKIQSPPPYPENKVFEDIYQKILQSIREALSFLTPCNSIEVGSARVEQVASNRRILLPDGKCLTRSSSCKDPKIIEAPEGLIDPYLRTLSFTSTTGKPIVRLDFYATHPQSFYWDTRASYDFPGMAREQIEKDEGIPHIYFTGCGGNIAAGKYNDGSPESRQQLYKRMLDAMQRSVKSLQKDSITEPKLNVTQLQLEPRNDGEHSVEILEAKINDTKLAPHIRVDSAMELAWKNRAKQIPIPVCALHIGKTSILHLPGEAAIEFQLFVQQCASENTIFVAAYGDCAPSYICPANFFTEGGYEPSASHVVPSSEQKLKEAIKQVL
ncbi:MAG TPA: hypothetical protein PLX23_11285 [Candidatus Hydrogenedens sp.]|nr:hypothetical protein [Candidatus Hydrogenedens sp.]